MVSRLKPKLLSILLIIRPLPSVLSFFPPSFASLFKTQSHWFFPLSFGHTGLCYGLKAFACVVSSASNLCMTGASLSFRSQLKCRLLKSPSPLPPVITLYYFLISQFTIWCHLFYLFPIRTKFSWKAAGLSSLFTGIFPALPVTVPACWCWDSRGPL